MDGQRFDWLTRRLFTRISRRRVAATLAGGLVTALPAVLWAGVREADAARCKKPTQRCRKTSRCCRNKKFKCGHSHDGGSVKKTCCGKVGAPCPGNALGCCIPLVCGPNNSCVSP